MKLISKNNMIPIGFFVYRKTMPSKSKGYSIIPVVGTRDLKISCSDGRYDGSAIRSASLRKLKNKKYSAISAIMIANLT